MKKTKLKDKAEALEVVKAVDSLCGYPRRGTHVGGGRHVEMPEAFTEGAPGWTATSAEPSDDGELILPPEFDAKLEDEEARAKLSAKDLESLDDLVLSDVMSR